jgi:glycosyltransferase involved in cell wall biosynthesis
MPNVVLEAMAAGLPVVATEVGGLSEVVKHGETGWLVPPKDVAALADSISQLLGDDARCATFGRAGRKLVESQFAVADMVRRHEEVFLQLARW